jgi:transposase
MPNRVHVLAVSDSERAELERRLRDRGALARDVARARIVLLSSQGLTGPEIGERVGCTEPTVVLWRSRFAKEGLAGLAERPSKPPPRTTVTDEVRDEICRSSNRLPRLGQADDGQATRTLRLSTRRAARTQRGDRRVRT